MPEPRNPTPPSEPAIRRGRARPSLAGASPRGVVVWGILIAAGGLLAWASVPRVDAPVATLWTANATSAGAAGQMVSDVRASGPREPTVLRMEWPGHPRADAYRVRFRAGEGAPLRSTETAAPRLLYDLDRNELDLPDAFEWAVAAVFPDGSEVVSPWQRFPE